MTEDSKNNVVAIVSQYTEIPFKAIMKNINDRRSVAEARYFCMLLMNEELKISKSEIGEFFNKHHTTVMYGIKTIRSVFIEQPEKYYLYNKMIESLSADEVVVFEDKYTELFKAYAKEKRLRKNAETEVRRLRTENTVMKVAYGYRKSQATG